MQHDVIIRQCVDNCGFDRDDIEKTLRIDFSNGYELVSHTTVYVGTARNAKITSLVHTFIMKREVKS